MSSTIKTFSITISIDKNECSYLNKIFVILGTYFCRIITKEKFETANLGVLEKKWRQM
jgi:hypothetical protein